jgi:IclR family pca regulon transcriptional regulator
MERLAETLHVSVFLSVRDLDMAVCVERVDRGSVRIATYQVGTTLPLTVGAGPLLLLAAQTDPEVEHLTGLPQALTRQTITDPRAIRERVGDARRRSIAWSDEDVALTMAAVAHPILSYEGGTVAAISVSTHRDDLFGKGQEIYASELAASAQTISRELGYQGPWPAVPLPPERPSGKAA